ncbi:hypothetical protein AMTR_s00008p00020330 [Amborella trichopoda]|uniref:G-protein coupled receptors family 2 profile 2 domain-containing protein n=1 Tax=Amborella trichopoda TaxID=13333 RepID=W1NHK0_AMBTC|nr:hypothetical protein AMTR_s00008p00020330 [Amborella trichopoda]
MFCSFFNIVGHKTDVEDLDLGPVFHLYVWGTSLVMTVIQSIANDYGHVGAWCWTQTAGQTGKVVQLITFYAPLWGAILFNGFTYFQVILMLNNATRFLINCYSFRDALLGSHKMHMSSLSRTNPAAPTYPSYIGKGIQMHSLSSTI